jgi:hypothetical protein
MSLKDYVVESDKFECYSDGTSRFNFPCCCCAHKLKSVDIEPCRSCGQNVNAELPK